MSEIDALIITALAEEYEAARAAGSAGYSDNPGVASWTDQDAETPAPYVVGDYVLAGGARISVALARPTRMGGTATTPVVASLVERLKPRCLAMCGVFAGNPSEVTPGDVVVTELADSWIRTARKLSTADLPGFGVASAQEGRYWLLDRLYAGDDPRTHPGRSRYLPGEAWGAAIRTLRSAGLLVRAGAMLSLTDEGFSLVEQIAVDDALKPDELPFAVVVDPIASGDSAAATIAHTARRLKVPHWLVAKGHADTSRGGRHRRFAARASAEVLYKLLTLNLTSRIPSTARLKSVYVIGGVTEETSRPDDEASRLSHACRQLGDTIAKAGAELVVCSPFPDSADLHTIMGYVQSGAGGVVHVHCPRHPTVEQRLDELRSMFGAGVSTRITSWYYPGPDNEESWGQAWLRCQLQALDAADAVISLGGRAARTASTVLRLAEARQKPVVPFEFLGGAARQAFQRRDWARAYPGLDYRKLQDSDGVTHAMEIAGQLVATRPPREHNYRWPPAKVFISRARADSEFGRALDEHFTGAGIEVLSGEQDAMLRSDLFIVLWSRNYAVSRFCHDEIELALQRHRVGELQLWIINLDGSDVVPRGARELPQAVARTPRAVVAVVRELLSAGPG